MMIAPRNILSTSDTVSDLPVTIAGTPSPDQVKPAPVSGLTSGGLLDATPPHRGSRSGPIAASCDLTEPEAHQRGSDLGIADHKHEDNLMLNATRRGIASAGELGELGTHGATA
jgi:hypothetical protein